MIKTAVNTGVEMALKIIEEGKRPMSPAQIKAKYQLEFPFTVKRVVDSNTKAWPQIGCNCSLLSSSIITFQRFGLDGFNSPAILSNPCPHSKNEPLAFDSDSERFVLI